MIDETGSERPSESERPEASPEADETGSEGPTTRPEPADAEPGAFAGATVGSADPEVPVFPPERRPLSQRPLFKVLFIVFAAALMLVLLGLLISPRYWRF